MKCWICNHNEANSREHQVQASDVDISCGEISKKKPIWFFDPSEKGKNRFKPIQGKRSKILKFNASLCQECNNSRTQKHDKAWEVFRDFIRENNLNILKKGSTSANRIFPYNTSLFMRYLQLFFVKKFGCFIVDNKIPLNIRYFGDTIFNNKVCDKIYLKFFIREETDGGIGMIHSEPVYDENNKIIFLGTEYMSDIFSVGIMYCENEKLLKRYVDKPWSPKYGNKLHFVCREQFTNDLLKNNYK